MISNIFLGEILPGCGVSRGRRDEFVRKDSRQVGVGFFVAAGVGGFGIEHDGNVYGANDFCCKPAGRCNFIDQFSVRDEYQAFETEDASDVCIWSADVVWRR